MKKDFELRIQKEKIVDTKKYRYYYCSDVTFPCIKRIELDKLYTVNGVWEIVKKYY